MATDLAHRADERDMVPAVDHSGSLLQQIIAASANPEVDAAKMEAMANLALKLQGHEQKQEYARDLAAAMREMPRISRTNRIVIPAKDGKPAREQGRFASFENIDAAVRPVLDRHNLSIRFRVGSDQGVTCTPIIAHRNGYEDVGDTMKVPADTSGSKNSAQAVGSAISYAKRYAMCAALNIVTEGDDRDGTTYPLEDDPMNDRQQRLVAEAHASHADGNYAAWWTKQSPKDREWLIIRGVHARLTGATQIPGPRTVEIEDQPDDGGETEDTGGGPPQPTERKQRTPRQMVDNYLDKVNESESTAALLAITEDPKTIEWLSKLARSQPDLHEEATTASSRMYAHLLSKEDSQRGQGDLLD